VQSPIFQKDLQMKTINVTFLMTNYIAHPFWPAKNACIEIEKKSGVNRQRTDEKRLTALKAECSKQGITYEHYLDMKKESEEQWYRRNGVIYIPRHQLAGAFVQAVGGAPKALRGAFDKDNFRALVQIGDFVTNKKEADGLFTRFVKLDGSNQRSLQSNEFLGVYLDKGEPFEATGVISVADVKTAETAKAVIAHSIEFIGVGAARKMGFGRGIVKSWSMQ
jgi:hypothetical protein